MPEVPPTVGPLDPSPNPASRVGRILAVSGAAVAVLVLLLWRLQADSAERSVLTRALVAAVQVGDEPAARRLLEQGADPNARVGESPPSNAWERLTRLLHLRRPEFPGDPLVLEAIYRSRPEMVELLLSRGADPNARSPLGVPPLHWAVKARNRRAAEALLSHGADPDARDGTRTTALGRAVSLHADDIAKLLRDGGAHE